MVDESNLLTYLQVDLIWQKKGFLNIMRNENTTTSLSIKAYVILKEY